MVSRLDRAGLPFTRRASARDLTLVEILIAISILLIVLLGVTATFSIAQTAQVAARERRAASLAAISKLEEIISWSEQNSFTGLRPQFDNTGFAVSTSPTEIGDSSVPGSAFRPAADASNLWNETHTPVTAGNRRQADASPATKLLAGYIDVVENVGGRTGLTQITVVVAYQSRVGAVGSEERVVYRQVLTQ